MHKRYLLLFSLMVTACAIITFKLTYALFSSKASSISNVFTAASVFPSQSPSASPAPSPRSTNHLVISEVFYNVDKAHGLDSPGERSSSESARIATSAVPEEANTDVLEGDDAADCVSTDECDRVKTTALRDRGLRVTGPNDEWIELYNPTDHTINVRSYRIFDNSGAGRIIHGNRIIAPGSFALIAKDNSTWNLWDEPAATLKIALGRQIGDGLQNAGDRIILKDLSGKIVDTVSWGADTSVFTLPAVQAGHSLARAVAGLDTDTASDWTNLSFPTPGN